MNRSLVSGFTERILKPGQSGNKSGRPSCGAKHAKLHPPRNPRRCGDGGHESRIVPILKPLAPILAVWEIRTGGEGLLFKPACPTRGGRKGQPPSFMRPHTLHRHLARALATCELSTLTWYQATRHTFASQ